MQFGQKTKWIKKNKIFTIWVFTEEAWKPYFNSVQFSHSVVSDSCDPMNRSMPGLPVHHQLPEFTQTHLHWVADAI